MYRTWLGIEIQSEHSLAVLAFWHNREVMCHKTEPLSEKEKGKKKKGKKTTAGQTGKGLRFSRGKRHVDPGCHPQRGVTVVTADFDIN
uniref:Uncharacterized protein n=1 Tax=Anguilla anguilla TaxID=7936 RepID=A0A0E9WX50_ANGAN